ncbi:MAG: OmpH family outer membrane protein [Gammaproteobacteria bacterium]
MTRTQTAVGFFGALLLLAASGAAQAQSNFKIGYININAIIQNAPQIPAINQQLRDEFAQRDTAFQEMQGDYTEKVETFERDSDVMGQAERESLARELTQMQRDLERRSAELQEDLQIRQNELLSELQVELLEKVQAYAELNDYDLIVTEAVYASDVVNITAAVYEAISAGIAVPPAAEGATEE